jgi:hypothetical protein
MAVLIDIEALHARVAAVCPIVGVSAGPPTRIDYADGATIEERAAARAVVEAYSPLSAAQDERLALLRSDASAAILAAAPEHKQRNAALGIYGAEETKAIKDAIEAGRAAYATAEAAVLAAQTVEDVEAVTYGA